MRGREGQTPSKATLNAFWRQIGPEIYMLTMRYCSYFYRVGHRILFCSVRSVRSVLFRSFFEFLATYETKKTVPFFSNELKRTQRTQRSFAKSVKECKERNVLLQRT